MMWLYLGSIAFMLFMVIATMIILFLFDDKEREWRHDDETYRTTKYPEWDRDDRNDL